MTHMILAAGNWINFGFVTTAYMKVLDAYLNISQSLAHRREVNNTINELNQLTNRELADLGISRGMIRSVAEGTHRV